jgi:hypothetical protein
VILDGELESEAVFTLDFTGHGTARLWLQSDGDVLPESGNLGALLPRASKAGTINVPATNPKLIAVGATLNRVEWDAYTGTDHVVVRRHGALTNPAPDSIALFSSGGPTATGWLKPDIVAPGAYVIGAMASVANPLLNGHEGMFAAPDNAGGLCAAGVECLVVDEFHAVASGTSMAAPVVSGAIALLLEQDPTLTALDLLTLLQSGARRPEGTVLNEQQLGPGALDLDGALSARLLEQQPIRREPAGEHTLLVLADAYAHPDAEWPLLGLLELHDSLGNIADAFEPNRLQLSVTPRPSEQSLVRVGPGLWKLEVSAPPGSGGATLQIEVRFDGRLVAARKLPIAVDREIATDGVAARGGCAARGLATGSRARAEFIGFLAAVWLVFSYRRRSKARVRRS